MKIGLLATIEAKPEHAEEVAAMLGGAVELANADQFTQAWFAFRVDATTFGVFDTFGDEAGRRAHLEGRIAAALTEAAATTLAAPPDIREIDLLGVKLP